MTHTAKHTPGPWSARRAPKRNAYAWDVEGARGTVPTIARMGLVDRVSEVEANAHLIAAAPAMYADAKQLCELVRGFMADNLLYDGRVVQGIENLEKALAQADGRDK